MVGGGTEHIRGGAKVDAANIRTAVEGSLRRLGTDVIDLYQIHWPPRGHYHFRGQWAYDPSGQVTGDVLAWTLECLQELGRQVDAGKIRAIGLSNETCWGTMQFLRLAEAHGLPRVASVQNEYSLLYRTHDLDFAELSHHEDVGLLSYSPLAAGLLSGKYSGGQIPPGSRGAIQVGIFGRNTDRAQKAADAYASLARQHGLDPVQMALAFCMGRPFMTSSIIGATSPEQLRLALGSTGVRLDEDVLKGIGDLFQSLPAPF